MASPGVPTPAPTATWGELLAHPDVVERSQQGAAIGVMAYHGGLEGGTSEIAEAVAAATGASLYTVDQPPHLRWHVPSRSIGPAASPDLTAWLEHVEVAIALHGYGRIARPRRILVGGRNRPLAVVVARELTGHLSGFEVTANLEDIPADLRGLHPDNPVNRPRFAGVQLELPPSARGTSLRPPDPAWGPGGAPARVVDALVAAVRSWPSSSPPPGLSEPVTRG
jgi:phage replication-related protein YjqB (UPF0714/DUF867 family)